MNDKTAKAARRLARKHSAGLPAYQLVGQSKANPKTAINYMKSTRGIYKFIKRLLRQGVSMDTIERSNADAKSAA